MKKTNRTKSFDEELAKIEPKTTHSIFFTFLRTTRNITKYFNVEHVAPIIKKPLARMLAR